MKSKLLVQLVLGISLLAGGGPALAHHGGAAYGDKLVELKQATVTKFLWSSPHSLVNFDVKDDKGNVVHWVVETGPPSALTLIGWTKTSFAPGDVVTVYLYPTKTGAPVGRLQKIVLPDGTQLHDTQLGGDVRKGRYVSPDEYEKGSNDK
jgi:Family of unknown function (DUF6152)